MLFRVGSEASAPSTREEHPEDICGQAAWRVFRPKRQEVTGGRTERHNVYTGSRDSSVGTATGYGLDSRDIWVRFPVGV
jgi:hypothetical protein